MNKRAIVKIIATLVLVIGGSVAGTAFADEATYTPTAVGCFDNGHCFVSITPSVGAWNTCPTKTQVRWLLSAAGGDEMYRTALSAFLAGRKLNINTYAGAACVDGLPQVWYLYTN